MDRHKEWYWTRFRPAERVREREDNVLRKEAAEFRKRTGEKRVGISIWQWLVSLTGAKSQRGETSDYVRDFKEQAGNLSE